MTVSLSCMVLGVSRSGFYQWKTRPESERAIETKALSERILEIHRESDGTYGMPRILETLKKEGKNVGKTRIEKVMKTIKNIRSF
ncbi:MAG: IS3 family transposase [Xanthomonadaceae bacterium]|nr:IS3 family transposase [Xanthomonadaceae bacterium]